MMSNGTRDALYEIMKCIDFHRIEWKHRPLTLYYVKYSDGRIFHIWAHDVTDVCDSKDKSLICEYGNMGLMLQ